MKPLATVLLLMLVLGGCSVDGMGAHVDQRTAVEIAVRNTPLTKVDKVEGSIELPFRHLLSGRDQMDRKLVVWVSTEVTHFVYLDEIISSEAAVQAATQAGLVCTEACTATLGHKMNQARTVYWHVSSGGKVVRIDAQSGQVLTDTPSPNSGQ